MFANILLECLAGIIEIWEEVAIILPRLDALTGFIRILRGLDRQIAAIRWQAGLDPGFFLCPFQFGGGD